MKKIPASILVSAIVLSSQFGVSSAHATDCPSSPFTAPMNLESAFPYQILAGAALTLGATVDGADNNHDGINGTAVADMSAAIASVAGCGGTTGTADLGGVTYSPGLYLSPAGAAFAVTGDVTLDAEGTSDAIFIFYTPAALNTTAGIKITLTGGALAKNVYWMAGGAITTGASDILSGTFMSNAAITVGASTLLTGRLLGAAAVTVGASTQFLPLKGEAGNG